MATAAEDGAEVFEELFSGAGPFRVERIVSRGQSSPEGFWYDQDEHEWVLLLKGAARLRLEGREEPVELGPGDTLVLPARCRHRVEWTAENEETVWLAIHFSAEPAGA